MRTVGSSSGVTSKRRAGLPSEKSLEAFEQAHLELRLRVTGFRGFLRFVEAPFDAGEVGERQLDGDDLAVAHRIGHAHHVLDVGVLEADDVDDGVHFADVGEFLLAPPVTRRCREIRLWPAPCAEG